MSRGRRILDPLLGRRRLQPAYVALHRVALAGMNFGADDVEASGEAHALTLLGRAWNGLRPTVFDVGANQGAWARLAHGLLHPGALHCFEPSPSARAILEQAVAGTEAHVHPYALGAADGEGALYTDAPASGLASLHQRRLVHRELVLDRSDVVKVRRLDDVCAELGIDRIHLLKLDVEGGELAALEGGRSLLERGAIDAIQFEFGGADIDARVFFQDFYYLLASGYRIHRVLRDGLVPVRHYRELDEIFVTANYLCLSRSAGALAGIGA